MYRAYIEDLPEKSQAARLATAAAAAVFFVRNVRYMLDDLACSMDSDHLFSRNSEDVSKGGGRYV